MTNLGMRRALLAATAFCALATSPGVALAQDTADAHAAALEARLEQLEAAVAELRGELARSRAAAAQTPAPPQARQLAQAEPPATPAPVRPAADGFSVGGTRVRINGYVKTNVSVSNYADGAVPVGSTARDFYQPGAIPVGGKGEGASFEASAKQTRVVLGTDTPLGRHSLKGLLEFDFQSSPGTGNQRVTNAYSPALRRAFFTYDHWLFGQEWTNFQYLAAMPETTDYLGPTEGTVFVRQPQVRYTTSLSPDVALSVSIENPETTAASAGNAAIGDYDNDSVPDATARLAVKWGGGEFSMAGLVRDLRVANGGADDSVLAWGVSAGGKIPFGKRHDLRFMVTHGEGIGRYVGLNFAPDAILLTPGGDPQLETVALTAGFGAVRIGWTDRLRSTVMGSFQTIDYPEGLGVATANKHAWSAAANLFYSPVKPLDLGIEFRHGQRVLVSGNKGDMDRTEFTAKYNF